MARSVEDLEAFAKAVVGAEPWMHDPKALPIPWRAVESKTKLKLGIIWNDGMVTPTPPVQRALRETVEKLKKAGHEIIDWDPAEHREAVAILARMFVADGGKSVRNILEPVDEPFRPEMDAYEKATELGVYDLWQLQIQRTDLLKRYLDQWNKCGIDALLGPTTPYASVPNGTFRYVGYTGIFNIVDYPAISFPTGIVADKGLDTKETDRRALGPVDELIQEEYNAEAVHGMPVSLQLTARRLEEEKAIDMIKNVLRAL
jgi:amidase